jgi:hypothetical protein
MKGYVYFIQINGMQPIKIGYTTDPKGTDRFDSAKTYAPFGLTYVANIPSSNAAKLEKELHQRFADKRLNGEWFDINQAQAYKIAMQYGGNAGAPTLDVDLFNEMHSEDYTIPELPLRVQQWYTTLPNSFTIDFVLNDKTQAASNEAANIAKQATIYKWIKRLRDLRLIEADRTGMYIKTNLNQFTDYKLPLNVYQWYETLPNTFKRNDLLSEAEKEKQAKFNINATRTMDYYLAKLKQAQLLYADNTGNYIKTQLQ